MPALGRSGRVDPDRPEPPTGVSYNRLIQHGSAGLRCGGPRWFAVHGAVSGEASPSAKWLAPAIALRRHVRRGPSMLSGGQ
jgi:hypothetical protein